MALRFLVRAAWITCIAMALWQCSATRSDREIDGEVAGSADTYAAEVGEARKRAEAESAHAEARFAKRAPAPPQPASAGLSQGLFARNAYDVDEVSDSDKEALARPAAPGEELWILVDEGSDQPRDPSEYPRLETSLAANAQPVPLPLQHTNAKASIAGYVASVAVTQKYHNPYSEKIEAVYVFPLPENAAVKEFVMTVGERRIRSIIRKREEAEQIYEEAKQQGYVAALLTQHRPNIFRQAVANLEPGKSIDIDITYFHTLRYDNGELEYVFPMVVGPRFNPPGVSDGVGAVGFGKHGASGQSTEVQYLPPGTRSGHDIALNVDLDAGVAIEELTSPSHAIEVEPISANRRKVTLNRLDTIPNKDFRLRYRVAGGRIKPGLIAHRDQRGGFFSLLLVPPASLDSLPRAPMELVFVIDCSGSMSGTPLEIAKATVERALRQLTPDDTFQIIQFSESAYELGRQPLPATPANVALGLDYLRRLNSEGGTMMIEGIKAALDFPHDRRRERIVSFLTDGYIGNEREILGEVHRRLGAARIFSFGIGSSTNRYLLEQMAFAGHGAAAFVGVDESSARAVDGFYEAVSHPALTDITFDWSGVKVSDVYPQRVPDLFVGRPVVVAGRFSGGGKGTVRVRGKAGGKESVLEIPFDTSHGAQHPALADVWARARIADLEDEETTGPDQVGAITEVALSFGLASAYTAFVAVDSSQKTAGSYGTTVVQPVPVPHGVRYDTAVQ